MSRFGGLVAAVCSGLLVFAVASSGAANLDGPVRLLVVGVCVLVGAVAGYFSGTVVVRRAAYDAGPLALFSGLAGAVWGGAIGGAVSLAVSLAYIVTYSTWPGDPVGDALLALAVPALGLTGLCVGALLGMIAGLLCGSVLKVASLAR